MTTVTDKPTPTGTLVRQWVGAPGRGPFTKDDLMAYIMDHDDTTGTYEAVLARVHVVICKMLKAETIKITGRTVSKGRSGKRLTVYATPDAKVKATPDRSTADSQPEPEPPAAPAMPDVITDHQMGRSIYNYITRLRGDLAAAEDRVRKGQDQYRLALAEHRGQLEAKDVRIAELEHELAEVRVRLQAQTVIRRPAVRTMAIGELIGQG